MSKQKWSDLYRLEDWWAIWLGFLLLGSVLAGWVATVPKIASAGIGAMTMKRESHKLMGSGLVAALAGVSISLLFPWLAQSGWAGEAVQKTHQENRDASAIFYTDSEHLLQVVDRPPRKRLPKGRTDDERYAPDCLYARRSQRR
ncbi:MAG TPA: hypothetical protein VLU25_04215 [Acidobacteriota bacterium]|nr:hypothetical protein [Acidobacteriota bacterium]